MCVSDCYVVRGYNIGYCSSEATWLLFLGTRFLTGLKLAECAGLSGQDPQELPDSASMLGYEDEATKPRNFVHGFWGSNLC